MTTARFTRGITEARTPGAQTWLNLVWTCNDIEAGFFSAPTSRGDWWAGGTVEEYPHARIITDSESVRIASTTEHGHEIIAQAAATLGVTTDHAAQANDSVAEDGPAHRLDALQDLARTMGANIVVSDGTYVLRRGGFVEVAVETLDEVAGKLGIITTDSPAQANEDVR